MKDETLIAFNNRIVATPACSPTQEKHPDNVWQDALNEMVKAFPELAELINRYPSLSLLAIVEASPHMRNLILNNPERLINQLNDLSQEAFQHKLNDWRKDFANITNEADLMQALRLAKQSTALFLGLADLAALWPVMAITKALTDFAELALSATINFLLNDLARRGHYLPIDNDQVSLNSGLIVLAMGKMGAFELNYSSDIDLIIFFDASRPHLKNPDEATSLFTKMVRRMIKIMQERTADGYVFRTDLRLRPDPSSTSVAIPVEAAMVYYESLGQPWERAALIKARPVAGDLIAAHEFLDALSPFIWRRYVDASVLLEVRRLKQRMETHKGLSEHNNLCGRNIKIGRGGIREIEFLVQTKQLMLGGRNMSLRCKGTLEALYELQRFHHINLETYHSLGESYLVLRDLEHRVQMVRDEQSHTLPDEEGIEAFAHFAGYSNTKVLEEKLDHITSAVQTAYQHFFFQLEGGDTNHNTANADGYFSDLKQVLNQSNLASSMTAQTIMDDWQSGRYSSLRSETARQALQSMLPHLLEALTKTGNAEAGLVAFDQFLRGLPMGVQLFSLFHANPALLTLLLRILSTAPRLAEIIRRRPHVFDGLLDLSHAEDMDHLPDENYLITQLNEARNEEAKLDTLRIFVKERQFLLGAHVLSGLVNPDSIAQGFTQTAEIAIRSALTLAKTWMAERHGSFPDQKLVLLALGRLGAADMTTHSDLDLIVIYDNDEATLISEGADGIKPLMATQYFAKLTQRLVTLLSAPTSEGSAYELDFRLRPSGNSGPLAVSLSTFTDYQHTQAWLWEHMALTRARIVAGDANLSKRVEHVICDVIQQNRDKQTVHQEIMAMRQRIAHEKPAKSPFDLKYTEGGLIDLEFMVQALFLTKSVDWLSAKHEQGKQALYAAGQAGLIGNEDIACLTTSWHQQKRLNQILRLLVMEQFDDEAAQLGTKTFIAELMGVASFDDLKTSLLQDQAKIRRIFNHFLA